MKKVKDLLAMEDLDLESLKRLPFQAQIYYTALNGNKCVRVITNNLEISNDRDKLEKEANFDILGLNAIKQTSKLARKGDYLQAQINAKVWEGKIAKASNTEQVNSH